MVHPLQFESLSQHQALQLLKKFGKNELSTESRPTRLKTLLPPQIVFLEFLIDPACSFVFEAEAEDPAIMTRKPRPRGEKILGLQQFLRSLVQGLVVFSLVLVAYGWALISSHEVDHARSLGFTSLIFGNLALILVNRSSQAKLLAILKQENRLFPLVILGALGSLILILLVPELREVFAFGHLEIADLGISALVGGICALLAQATKRIHRKSGT